MKNTKIFTFDSSHMLDGHDGKCQNLHGHTYSPEITVAGSLIESGAKAGMVMDFSDLKSIVKQSVIDPFDHAFIYHGDNEREKQNRRFAGRLEHENPAFKPPHHCRKYGGRNLPTPKKRRLAGMPRETVGNTDFLRGI